MTVVMTRPGRRRRRPAAGQPAGPAGPAGSAGPAGCWPPCWPGWPCWWRSRRTGCGGLAPVGVALLTGRGAPARMRAGAGLGALDRAGALPADAELDQPATPVSCRGCCCPGLQAVLPGAAGRPPPRRTARWWTGSAGRGRLVTGRAVGGAGGAAGPDPVRRVPVGPAGVQPGRLAAAAAGRARRRPAGHLRGGARRRAAGRRRWLGWSPLGAAAATPGGVRRWPLDGAGRAGVACAVVAGGGGRRLAVGAAGAGRHRPGPARRTVAIVQGNVPRLGLDFNAQRQAVLENHVDATIELAGQVAAGAAPQPDLVVWPENASDIDPLRNADAGARITEAADAIGAPILVGAVLLGPGRRAGPQRRAGVAAADRRGPRRRCTSNGTRCRSPSTCRCATRPDGQRGGRPGPQRLRRRAPSRACCGSAGGASAT